MKRANEWLGIIENADDGVTDLLAERYDVLSGSDKDRIFSLIERSGENMKSTDDINVYVKDESVKTVEIQSSGKWYKHIWRAAACFIAVTAAAGMGIWIYSSAKIRTDDSYVGSVEDSSELYGICGTVDTDCSGGESNENLRETGTVSVSGEDSPLSDTDTSVYSYSSRDDDGKDKHDTDSAKAAASSETDEERPVDEQKAEQSGESSAPVQTYYGDECASVQGGSAASEEPNGGISYSGTLRERLLCVTDSMTYGEVMDILGEPDTLCITKGCAQYIVDGSSGDRLLLLFYDNEDDVIGKDGQTLYDESILLSDLYESYKDCEFESIVVSCSGAVRVTCPQYPRLGCADLSFTEGTERPELNVGDRVLIKHRDDVLECYPPIIYVEGIEVIK